MKKSVRVTKNSQNRMQNSRNKKLLRTERIFKMADCLLVLVIAA